MKSFGCFNKKYDDGSLESIVKRSSKNIDFNRELELQDKENALLPEEEREQLIKNEDNIESIQIKNNNNDLNLINTDNIINNKNSDSILENNDIIGKGAINEVENIDEEKIIPEEDN